jgi:hypothetical protein
MDSANVGADHDVWVEDASASGRWLGLACIVMARAVQRERDAGHRNGGCPGLLFLTRSPARKRNL